MVANALTDVPSDGLLGLLREAADRSSAVWGRDDYAAIWRHQLAAPLVMVLRDPQRSFDAGDVSSIGDLLASEQPPTPAVQLAIQHAKACVLRAQDDLPEEVARVLYFMLVWVGRYRCRSKVSSLPDTGLRDGLVWAADRPWLDDPTRSQIASMIRAVA